MNALKISVSGPLILALAACGGSGGGMTTAPDVPAFNTNLAVANGTPGETLAASELDTGGTADPTDDVVTATGGFALSASGATDSNVASTSTSTTSGPSTTVTLNGTEYTLGGIGNTSADGTFTILTDGTVIGDLSRVAILGTGTDLGTTGTPDELYGYVRGLGTPFENLPSDTMATYSGTANSATVGSSDVAVGTFDATVDFAAGSLSGSYDTSAIAGSISADLSGAAFEGSLSVDGSSDSLMLSGNLYGGDAQEIAGAAQGNVGGDDTLVVFQGAKQ